MSIFPKKSGVSTWMHPNQC